MFPHQYVHMLMSVPAWVWVCMDTCVHDCACTPVCMNVLRQEDEAHPEGAGRTLVTLRTLTTRRKISGLAGEPQGPGSTSLAGRAEGMASLAQGSWPGSRAKFWAVLPWSTLEKGGSAGGKREDVLGRYVSVPTTPGGATWPLVCVRRSAGAPVLGEARPAGWLVGSESS